MSSGRKGQNAEAVFFKRLYGVTPDTFTKMLSMLQKEFDELHKKGGKPLKLTSEDKRYITLKYLKQYPTMDSLAAEYAVCKGTVCLAIQGVEDTLAKKGAQEEVSGNSVYRGRCNGKPYKPPKRGPKGVLFGKKKRRTLKTQVILERNSLEIIDVQEDKGSGHDFKIYKDTMGSSVSTSIPLDADLGYLGIGAYHRNSFIPIKASKKHPLSKGEKGYNKRLARRRVVIEHINAKIKTCKSMAYPYRGHCCNRHSTRMALICGIVNYDRRI